MATRQQLEQQLVAAHRTGNVQAAQQAAYAIRQYDQSALSAQVPSINAPPPIERVPKPTFGSWLENVGIGIGEGLGEQVQGIGELAQRGASALGAYAKDPLKASAAAFMGALAPAMRGFTQPAQTARDVGAGVVETGKQMYQQATSGPVGLGTVIGQNLDLPGPGGQRRPTMAELDVYHGTPHTFEPEEGAPLGRFRSSKIGTGEGAQAYGHGLYLAENEKIGRHYKEVLSKRKQPLNYTYNGVESKNLPFPARSPQRIYAEQYIAEVNKGAEPEKIIEKMKNDARSWLSSELKILKRYEKDLGKTIDIHNGKNDFPEYYTYDEGDIALQKEAVEVAKSYVDVIENFTPDTVKFTKQREGSLYKVDLPDAKIEQMLDWDRPISQQPAMQKAFNKFWKGLSKNERAQAVLDEFGDYDLAEQMAKSPGEVRGRLAYSLMTHHFDDPAAASDFLRQQGVPGIKYLDAGSRAGEKGTRNFVVFPGEEQNLTILERDGVKAEVPKPDELAYHGTTKQAAAAIEREGFDLTRAADGTVWFTSNPNIGEVAATGKGGIVARSVSGLKLGGWDEMDKYSTDELIAKGYDGLRLKDGDEITYQIFNPEKLKVPTKKAK